MYVNLLECNCQSSAFSAARCLVGVQGIYMFSPMHETLSVLEQVHLSMRLFAPLHFESCPAEPATEKPPPVSIFPVAYKYEWTPPFPEPKAFIFNVYAGVSSCIMVYLSHNKKAAVQEFRKDVFGLAASRALFMQTRSIEKPRNLSTQAKLVRIVRVQKLHNNHEATSYRLDD